MGGLQRGRAGGCNVMRRPQVAAEFKESTFNFNLTFAEDSLLIQSSKWQLLNLKVNTMLDSQERAAEDFEAGAGQEAENGQSAPNDRKYCVDIDKLIKTNK